MRLPYNFIFCAGIFFFFNRRSDTRLESGRGAGIFFLAIGLPFGIAILGDLLHGTPRLNRLIFELFGNWFGVSSSFQDQPLILLVIAANAHECPFPFGFLAVEDEMKFAFQKRFRGLFPVNVIGAAVPNHHRATAVVCFGNDAFEGFVFDRMVFDFHREMFFAFLPGKPFRYRPRF